MSIDFYNVSDCSPVPVVVADLFTIQEHIPYFYFPHCIHRFVTSGISRVLFETSHRSQDLLRVGKIKFFV